MLHTGDAPTNKPVCRGRECIGKRNRPKSHQGDGIWSEGRAGANHRLASGTTFNRRGQLLFQGIKNWSFENYFSGQTFDKCWQGNFFVFSKISIHFLLWSSIIRMHASPGNYKWCVYKINFHTWIIHLNSHQWLQSELQYHMKILQCAPSSTRLEDARKGLIHHENVPTKHFPKFKSYLFTVFWSILFVLWNPRVLTNYLFSKHICVVSVHNLSVCSLQYLIQPLRQAVGIRTNVG